MGNKLGTHWRHLILTLFLIMPGMAHSATTGAGLISLCESEKEILRNNCRTYINAFVRGLLLGQAISKLTTKDVVENAIARTYGRPIPEALLKELARMGRDICLPSHVRPDDLVTTTKEFIARRPQARKEPAQALIYRAVKQAYPCR